MANSAVRAPGTIHQAAWSGRLGPALVVFAYLMFTGGSLALLLVAGGWALLLLPAGAGIVYLAMNLFRASLAALAFMPQLASPIAREGLMIWYTTTTTLGLAWLIALLRGRVSVSWHYLALYGLFLVAMTLSLIFGVDPRMYLSSEWVFRHQQELVIEPLLTSITALFLMAAVTGRRQLRALAWTLVFSGVGYSATVILVRFPPEGRVVAYDFVRPTGVFATLHHAGLFGVFYLLVSAALWVSEGRAGRRAVLAGSAALFLAVIYVSRSYTAWVTLALVTMLGLVREFPRLRHRIHLTHIYAASVAGVLLALAVLGWWLRVAPLAAAQRNLPPFWEGRLALVKLGLELFWENPVTGVGLGNHTLLISAQQVPFGYAGSRIHTHAASLLAESGVLGTTAFALIVLVATVHFLRAMRTFRARGDVELYHLTHALFLGLWAVVITSFNQSDIGSRLFWALVAMAFVTRALARGPESTVGGGVAGGQREGADVLGSQA